MKYDSFDLIEFYNIATKIINTSIYQELKKYKHHKDVSVYDHCLEVARRCFIIAKKKKMNVESVVKGALLHDFYLYDWHDKNKGFRWHGFKHAKFALDNAKAHFSIDKVSENMIITHMWPLNLFKFPKYKESWLLCRVDKVCSFKETFFKTKKYKEEK